MPVPKQNFGISPQKHGKVLFSFGALQLQNFGEC